MEKKTVFWTLAGIVAVSFVLHVYRISYPAQPVFDEAHFATYAADFARGAPSFDIHPPLGKLIYAAALRLGGYEATAWDSFVQIVPLADGGFRAETVRYSFGDFPFVLLRVVSALFGIALPALLYFFLRSIGLGAPAALVGAFFVAAENALLVQTRFIFLDGMYLAFGLASLALYFRQRTPTWLSGALFGLALGVKLTAVTFIGPVVADMFLRGAAERRVARRRAGAFLGIGAFVCAASFVLGSAFVAPVDQRELWNAYGVFDEAVPVVESGRGAAAVLRNAGMQMLLSLSGYVGGGENRDNDIERTSRWYDWPLAQQPMLYFTSSEADRLAMRDESRPFGAGSIVLAGNGVVRGLSASAVLVALFSALVLFVRSARGRAENADRQLLLLGAGYITSMLPFMFLVDRPTYPYHYFPALIFAIGLFAWLLERELGLTRGAVSARQIAWLVLTVGAAIAGFVAAAPTTYGH